MNILLHNKKGSALIYVMFALIMIMIMISIVFSITTANTMQASEQEIGMRAYYTARSGVEAAYESLFSTTPSLLNAPTNSFKSNPGLVKNDTLDFEDGTAVVTVDSSGTGDTQKIKIKSLGTIGDVSRTVTLEFYLNYDKYQDMVWSK